MIYQVKGISGHQWECVGCVRVCAGVHWCVQVCAGVPGCARMCMGVQQVCTGVHMRVWDEFSEFLPENRVPTSADFNTYPIRIFLNATNNAA